MRYNDRDFKVGDILVLEEYDPDAGLFTGASIRVKVSFILYGDADYTFGVAPDYCIMSICREQDAY